MANQLMSMVVLIIAKNGLQKKVVLITGSGRGIGRAIAESLAKRQMAVAVNSLSDSCQKVAQDLTAKGLTVIACQADITDKKQVDTMFDTVEDQLGPVWMLVNNAGTYNSGPTVDMSETDWNKAFDVNAKAVFLCSQAAVKRMTPRKKGRIVNISSISGLIARTEQIGYCCAKASAIHFSRCLALEIAHLGITVNCICPGMTRTEMFSSSTEEHRFNVKDAIKLIPDGRLAEPEDYDELVAYFASEKSSHVTGQVISIDGGQSQYMPLASGNKN